MTATRKRRSIELAACLTAMMHLLLFMAVRPLNGNGPPDTLVPPATRYLANPSIRASAAGGGVRTIWSPVLFSLPSKLGFSRDLIQDNLRTRLTFTQPAETESFLEVEPASRSDGGQIVLRELMLTAGRNAAPQLPVGTSQPMGNRPLARRVYVAPELKERLVGGVVLPPELNKEGTAPWEIRADMSISKQGIVQHVFLEHPLEAAALNQAVIHLLYGLRFASGDGPVEGSIEIYSPETVPGAGADQ